MTTGLNLVGTTGNDFLRGSGYDDTIDGGAGNDVIFGGSSDGSFGGNDTYIFGKNHGADVIASNHQTREPYDNFASGCSVKMTSDVLAKDVKLNIIKVMISQEDSDDAPQWNLTITLKNSADVLTIEDYLYVGRDGRGEIRFVDGTTWTYTDVISKVAADPEYIDYVLNNGALNTYQTGHNANDTLSGTSAGEYLDGSAGNDSISGYGGDDSIFGGLGNDSVNGGSGNDYIRDDFGNNWVTGGTGNDNIVTGSGNDSLSGADGDDAISSGSGNDTINGGDGNDSLGADGGAGTNVTLLGKAGNDSLFAGEGNGFLDGGDGNDDLYVLAGTGNHTLVGGTGDDHLTGGSYTAGGVSNTVLDGGAGNDKLTAIYGTQTFVFDLGYGFDTIYARHDDRPNVIYTQTGLRTGDVVKFDRHIASTDITLDIVQEHHVDNYFGNNYTQTWWHLDMHVNGTTDTLRVDDYFIRNPADRGTIQFDDGTTWTHADILSMTSGDVDTIAFNTYAASLGW